MGKIKILILFVVVGICLITYNMVYSDNNKPVFAVQNVKNASLFEIASESNSGYTYILVANFSIVSVCVPAIAADMKLGLPRLIESIQKQTHVPLEVIIVMSNVNSEQCKIFDEKLKLILTSTKLRLICVLNLQYQSISRQNASALAQGTIISFIDADDIMYPNRIEVIVEMFTKYKPFMVLHGFSKNMEPPPNNKWKEARVLDGIELHDIANKTLSIHLWILAEMMHSQVSVLRYVCTLISFRTSKEFYRIEDAWYIRDVISYFGRHNNTAVFINTPLARHLPREYQIG